MHNTQPVVDKTLLTVTDLEEISQTLCLAVDGAFDFRIDTQSENESIQKLEMLINFVLDVARRTLAEIKEKNKELSKLDQVKSDFLSNITHELRTRLTLILGPIQELIPKGDQKYFHEELNIFSSIHNNSCRLLVLVNSLLDLSKADAGKYKVKKEFLRVIPFLEILINDMRPIAEQNQAERSRSSVNSFAGTY